MKANREGGKTSAIHFMTRTNNSSLAINKAQVSNPAGAKVFDSGFLNPGQSFDKKFTTSGTYKYVCVPHETSGMVGTIVVK